MASGFAAASAGDSATAADLLAAGDLGPCELVRGTLVMMSPAGFEHGVVTQRIAAFLHHYVAARRLGVVTAAETGFEVWSVDPADRTVTVHASGGALTLANGADSFVSRAVPGLTVMLVDLFPPTS